MSWELIRRLHDTNVDVPVTASLFEDSYDGGLLANRKGLRAGFDNTSLVPGDVFDGATQFLEMISTDAGDGRDDRAGDDICYVELSAVMSFDNCNIDPFFDEYVNAEYEKQLKLSWRASVVASEPKPIPDLEEILTKVFVRYGFVVDTDHLVRLLEIGRCVESTRLRETCSGTMLPKKTVDV